MIQHKNTCKRFTTFVTLINHIEWVYTWYLFNHYNIVISLPLTFASQPQTIEIGRVLLWQSKTVTLDWLHSKTLIRWKMPLNTSNTNSCTWKVVTLNVILLHINSKIMWYRLVHLHHVVTCLHVVVGYGWIVLPFAFSEKLPSKNVWGTWLCSSQIRVFYHLFLILKQLCERTWWY